MVLTGRTFIFKYDKTLSIGPGNSKVNKAHGIELEVLGLISVGSKIEKSGHYKRYTLKLCTKKYLFIKCKYSVVINRAVDSRVKRK